MTSAIGRSAVGTENAVIDPSRLYISSFIQQADKLQQVTQKHLHIQNKQQAIKKKKRK